MMIELGNDVAMDFMAKVGEVAPQRYAFLVGDAGFERIKAAGRTYRADPARAKPGEINHRLGGRGVYFNDLDGHLLEPIIMQAESNSKPTV
jgi:catechol 2,3-dioxygenase-like lactoylglutathione lyase family enzyme